MRTRRFNTSSIRLGVLVGGAVALGLSAIDAWYDGGANLITTIVLAPFVTAMIAGSVATGVVAVLAFLLGVLSPLWNHDFGSGPYILRCVVVALGGVVAVAAAVGRERAALAARRFIVLKRVARLGDRGIQAAVDGITELLVPEFADACAVDLVGEDGVRRASISAPASGPSRAALEAEVADVTGVPAEGTILPPHRLTASGAESGLLLPMTTRGQTVGAVTMLQLKGPRPPYTRDDLEFMQLVAGRAGLVLDNAGLFAQRETLEAQLSAALGSLADAVTVQSRTGELVYANEAAAESLGFATAAELLATPVGEIVGRFDSFLEDGTPLDVTQLPGRRVLAGEQPDPLLIRAVDRVTGEERWQTVKATPVYDPDGDVRLAVNVIEDISLLKRAEVRQRILAEAGRILSSSLDHEATLQSVAELAVPDIADWCGVSMPDGRGFIRQVSVAHVDPSKVALARETGARYPTSEDAPDGAAKVIREGTTEVLNDIPRAALEQAAQDPEHLDLLLGLGLRSAVVVPMTAAGRAIGALTLVQAESGRTFAPADVALAEDLAARAGTAVENARLYTERSHIARTLQTGLLPPQLPDMPGWAAASIYRPAGDQNLVGGDFYDVVAVGEDWLVVIGDVAGKGAQAAAVTAAARHWIRAGATMSGSATEALRMLNRELGRGPELRICTICCVTFRAGDGPADIEVLRAGHPAPLLVGRDGIREVGVAGSLVGAWQEPTWQPTTTAMAEGDVLVLFTDGVLDAVGAGGHRFGQERLEAALAGITDPDAAVAAIDAALADFSVGPQADDTAVIAVGRIGTPAAAEVRQGSREGPRRSGDDR